MDEQRGLSDALLGDEEGRREITRALLEITSRAAANAEGEVGVGLSVQVGGKIESIGATSNPAEQMDHGQARDGEGPCLHALSSGESVGVDDYTADERWPETSRRAAETGIRSSLSLPLRTGELVLGALNVYSNAPAAFGREAAESLAAFAQQATTSLFLLGRLQAQRADSAYVTAFSHTIQASLRTVLPDVAGLELVGVSIASAPHAAVGGDWYDAFVLLDGSVGLVVGDVMGHGIEAVTAMAQVRTMVRTAAMAGLDPAGVLRVTDQLANQGGITETATVFYANLRTEGTGMRLRYCNAGHPAPLLRSADGSVTEVTGAGRQLIGAIVAGDPPRVDDIGTIDLPADTLLLLFTDGLTERRSVDAERALADLQRTLAAVTPQDSLEELCERLIDPPNPIDDTTVFAIRIRGQQQG